jgi:hypothetical protein
MVLERLNSDGYLQNMGAGMLVRSFSRLTTAAVLVATALLFAGPFFLTLISPCIR